MVWASAKNQEKVCQAKSVMCVCFPPALPRSPPFAGFVHHENPARAPCRWSRACALDKPLKSLRFIRGVAQCRSTFVDVMSAITIFFL